MIVVALIVVNVVAFFLSSMRGILFYDFLIIECYIGLGAIIGSKILYIITVASEIDWNRLFSEYSYFNAYLGGGFVFFGGIIGALPMALLGSRIHSIELDSLTDIIAFVVPLGHGIGRIGCFLAGCCYGIESDCIFSVVFPPGGFAPANVSLVPVQLFEALILFSISILVLLLFLKRNKQGAFLFYILSYAFVRFVIEFFRGDSNRGIYFGFSTSQWICLAIILCVGIPCIIRKRQG